MNIEKSGIRKMTVSIERRTRTDRRQRDSGPPTGCSERRRQADRRLPQVVESVFSDAEWEALFGGMHKSSNVRSDAQDEASDVLG